MLRHPRASLFALATLAVCSLPGTAQTQETPTLENAVTKFEKCIGRLFENKWTLASTASLLRVAASKNTIHALNLVLSKTVDGDHFMLQASYNAPDDRDPVQNNSFAFSMRRDQDLNVDPPVLEQLDTHQFLATRAPSPMKINGAIEETNFFKSVKDEIAHASFCVAGLGPWMPLKDPKRIVKMPEVKWDPIYMPRPTN